MPAAKNVCDCAICQHQLPFEINSQLLDDFLSGRVAVFAGAGISTESRAVLKYSFYEDIAARIESDRVGNSFPEVMQSFCARPDGRFHLLRLIKERFDHIASFPELNSTASRFHRELATLYQVRDIVTTNWDTYFERECCATPFVADADLAFWEAASRRVLKIHGSIDNYSTVVATNDDYCRSTSRLKSGLLGSVLKTILATKTIVFIGYSLSDPDFSLVFQFVKRQMRNLGKQAYVVTPFANECAEFDAQGLRTICTDGAFFLSQVKSHAVARGALLPDDVYAAAEDFSAVLAREHGRLFRALKVSVLPEVAYVASYQDGLMHSLDRAVQMRKTGQYSNETHLRSTIHGYHHLKQEKLTSGNYDDVAYIEGYVNGLLYLLNAGTGNSEFFPPMYFAFGVKRDLFDLKSFVEEFKGFSVPHKAARKRVLKFLSTLNDPDKVELHHPPWL